MPTRRKKLIYLLCLIPLGAIGLQYWLSTGPIRKSALAALEGICTGHVELERASLHWSGGLVLRKVRVHESASRDSPIVCEIPRVDVKGSIWDLMRKRFRPTQVDIHKPRLKLVFDTDGSIRPLPFHPNPRSSEFFAPIQISDGSISLKFGDGVSEQVCQLDRLALSLTRDDRGQTILISGSAASALGASWQITGSWLAVERQLQARVRSSSIELSPDWEWLLQPGMRAILAEFAPQGRVSVDAEVNCDLGADQPMQYQILIDPAGLSVRVPALGERLEDVAGRVEITPSLARVHGLVGRLGAGEVVVSGTVTRDEPMFFSGTAEARRLPAGRLVPKLKFLEGPAPVASVLSGTLTMSGSADPATWQGEFNGAIDDISHDQNSVPLHLSISDSQIRLRDLTFDWAGGFFEITAGTSLESDGVLSGSVKFERADLDGLSRLAPVTTSDVAGTATGQLTFQVPLRSWPDAAAWRWDGPVRIHGARVGNFDARSLRGSVRCNDGLLLVDQAVAEIAGQTFFGNAQFRLEPPFQFSAEYTMTPINLRKFAPATSERAADGLLSGVLAASGRMYGQLSPLDVKAGGVASLSELSVADVRVESTSFSYALAGAGFDLSGLDVRLFGGRIRARGRWNIPREMSVATATERGGTVVSARTSPAAFRLEGTFDDLDAGVIAQDFVASRPVRGRASGSFAIELPQDTAFQLDALRATGSIRSPQLAIGAVEVANVRSEFALAGGKLQCTDLSGTHPSGSFAGSAKFVRGGSRPALTARLASSRLELEKLVTRAAGDRPLPIRGIAAGELNLEWDQAASQLRGAGAARLAALVLDELPPIDSVTTTQLELAGDRLVLRNFQATLWGGVARGTATLDLAAHSARPAEIVVDRVENVELARVAVAWPATSSRPRGKVSGAGKLHLATSGAGIAVFGVGEYDFKAGAVVGLPVAQAEGTIEAFDAATHEIVSGRVQARRGGVVARATDQRLWIRVRNARAARGSVQGTILISLVKPAAYDTNLQFVGLDLATVAQSVFASPYKTAGALSGDLQLGGTARGPAATHGEMRLRLQNAQLWSIPPFAVLAKLITLDLTKSGGFHTAEVPRAVISGETVEFPEFWLAGDIVQLAGRGRVQMGGELDLEVVSSLKSETGRNLPIVGTIQDAMIGIQQQLVKFKVGGTIDDPTVIPVPLQILSEPAIKVLKGITGALFDPDERNGRPLRR